MLYKIKKKLLHFYTSGNVAEDFIAARRKKTAKFRRVIRFCFYLHCITALVCIALSIILCAGFDIVKVSVCALASVVFAFFAVGDLEHVKTISYVIDFAFAAGAFVMAALGEHKTLYLTCGILMSVLGLSMIVSGIAGVCKRYLDSVSPYMIRPEDYTRLSDEIDDIPDMPDLYDLYDIPDMPETIEEEIPPMPPVNSKMHELADQVCEIICGGSNKK